MRKFLYYILKEDGRSGKVVNGVVTYTGQPTPLPETPDGWQELAIGWERDLNDYGIVKNFSLPFGFVRDGAKIIRDALYNQSIEEKLYLLIQELRLVYTSTTYEWRYVFLYKGELDLSAAEDTMDIVSVPCMDGGLSKLLKANRATKYTYPFDLDAINIVMDGISLEEAAKYVCAGEISNDTFANTHTLPISFVNKEGLSAGIGFFTQIVEDTGLRSTYVASSSNYFLYNNSGASIDFNIKGKVFYTCTENSAGLSYRWFLTKQDDTTIDAYNSVSNPVVGNTYEVDIDFDFTLLDGEKMFFIGRYFGAGGVTIAVDFLDTTYLNVTFNSRFRETSIKGYKKSTLYRKLIGSVCGDESFAQSDLCELWDNIPVTSGDAIRGTLNPTITLSLNDFLNDVDSTFMAGLSVFENKIELEERQRYFSTDVATDLGTVKDITFSPALEFIYNKFKFGHPKPDIEDINGKYDPNGSNEFTGLITKVVKDYAKISPIKAGPYEIESLRLNLDGKVSTDDNRDSGVYVINCVRHQTITATVDFDAAGYFIISSAQYLAKGQQIQISGSVSNDGIYNITDIASALLFQFVIISGTVTAESAANITITVLRGEVMTLNRPTYTTLEGVPNNTIFNLPDLTPKAILKKHGRWIRSVHKGLESGLLKFNSADKNAALITELAGITIDEDADENIADLGEPMFLPFYASFTTQVPVDLPEILELTPNTCFTFSDESGNEFEGFLISAAIAPNELKEQEFKVLLTPNNNLTLLV